MSDEQPSVFARVEKIVRDCVAFDGAIGMDSAFEDLGFDNLDAVELTIAIENEFDFELPDDDARRLETVGHLVKRIEERFGS